MMEKQLYEADGLENDSNTPSELENESVIAMPAAVSQSFFGFRTGSLGFLVPSTLFCEVLDKFKVNQLPNLQPWFSGLINLRGNLVPVFDLRRVLNERLGDQKKQRLFVIGRGDKSVALWIDNYPEILVGATMEIVKDLPELPPVLLHSTISGRMYNGKIWLEVDLDSLFRSLGRHHHTNEEISL